MNDASLDHELPLQGAHRNARTRPNTILLTQPMGGGVVDDFSWARVMDESKRIAAHLRSYGFPPKSQIAILSKNCAHFIMTDLAIWMAGHVSVALYPTANAKTIAYVLEHSEAKLLFVGKLDSWDEQKAAVPAGLPCISYPLSPKTSFPTWNDLVAKTPPLEGEPVRPAEDLAIIAYTSGSTGNPKGVMQDFRAMAATVTGLCTEYQLEGEDRVLSYLPLAHVYERACIESVALRVSPRVFFAESLDTFIADLNRARPTVFVSVPRLWIKFQHGVFSKLPEQKLKRLLKIPIVSRLVKKKILEGSGSTRCGSRRAARRRFRPACCSGTATSASSCSRATR